MLGYRYDTGKGLPIDGDEAVRWYLKAAQQNNARAQHALGVVFKERRGKEASALEWFRRAAENGLAADNGHAAANYARDELAKRLTSEESAAGQARDSGRCQAGLQAV